VIRNISPADITHAIYRETYGAPNARVHEDVTDAIAETAVRFGQKQPPTVARLHILQDKYCLHDLRVAYIEVTQNAARSLSVPSLRSSFNSNELEFNIRRVRFEVLTAITMNNAVFWDVTPYGYCKNRYFGGT
jgi:hypothetical protein